MDSIKNAFHSFTNDEETGGSGSGGNNDEESLMGEMNQMCKMSYKTRMYGFGITFALGFCLSIAVRLFNCCLLAK